MEIKKLAIEKVTTDGILFDSDVKRLFANQFDSTPTLLMK